VEWIQLAQDRDPWRILVNEVMNLSLGSGATELELEHWKTKEETNKGRKKVQE
jgi:hypothetical protein